MHIANSFYLSIRARVNDKNIQSNHFVELRLSLRSFTMQSGTHHTHFKLYQKEQKYIDEPRTFYRFRLEDFKILEQ